MRFFDMGVGTFTAVTIIREYVVEFRNLDFNGISA